MLHMEKAFVSTLKNLSGAIRDDAQVWEARNLSRQRGYTHMGVVMTAKQFGFVQDLPRVCLAATREAGIVTLGAEGKKFALCKKPTAFRTFYMEVEAAEKEFIPVFSPTDLPTHMATFNTKLARALDKAIGLKSWKYVGPHVSRKHFLLMAQKFGGCCQNDAPPPPPLRPGSEDVWTKLWQTLTVDDLKLFCPDSGGHLDDFPGKLSAESLSLQCGGVPPMMMSAWACLLNDVVNNWSAAAYAFAKERLPTLRTTLDALLQLYGESKPPCPWVLMYEAMK